MITAVGTIRKVESVELPRRSSLGGNGRILVFVEALQRIKFSNLSVGQVRDALLICPGPGTGVRLIVTTNVDHILHLEANLRFREAYATAWLTTVDGFPISVLLRLQGVRNIPRVTGADLCAALIPALIPGVHRPFYVASSNITASSLASLHFSHGFTPSDVAIVVPPFGFEDDREYSRSLAARIEAHRTTHLFFGVGAPKSEIWLNEHRHQLGALFAMPFGAGLDFLVGTASRAPVWMQKCGLEWAWRLWHDPVRLFPRYFIGAFRLGNLLTRGFISHKFRK